MLCELRVRNLALIESLDLHFDPNRNGGLVVMTGETGAGKSIMLRAINLLTGRRASSDWIRTGADSCEVEALFELSVSHKRLLDQFEESGFGREESVIIKRIITSNGRSRLYINGSLATARKVTELTSEMVGIASQHDHQKLLQPPYHLDFIDTLGDLWFARNDFGAVFCQWEEKRQILQVLKQKEQDKEQKRDFLQFQVDEIRTADPQIDEDEQLGAEKKRLKNLTALIKISQETYRLMSNDIVEAMTSLRRNMEQLVELDPGVEKLAEDLGGYTYLADDYSQALRGYRDSLEDDPYRLDQVSERLDVLVSLKRKYGQSIEQVLEYAMDAEKELSDLDSMDQQIEGLEKEVTELEKELIKLGLSLSGKRRNIGSRIEKAMANELSSLAFNQSRLEVKWQEFEPVVGNLRSFGFDRCEFFFSANPGEPARPLAKVASGGELSRLMLALKCILAKKDMVDTVIFDEVDSGIGGEAAEAVARKIQELSAHHQVFCITHLPQIAARGNLHYLVSKEVVDDRTLSTVQPLTEDTRVGELVRMLAGDSATEQTYAWARQLLEAGQG